MPVTTEPQIVTIAEMSEHLAGRVAATEQALADVVATVAAAALAVERGAGDDALRTLASAEKRRDKLAGELERLRQAAGELDRQLEEQRREAEVQERRDMVAEYCRLRGEIRQANLEMLAAVEGIGERARVAQGYAREAVKLGRRLGLPDETTGRGLWPEVAAVKAALNGYLTATPRIVRDARAAIERDWRTTPNGRRAVELQAALGEGDKNAKA